jgi:hypothetical protein
MAGLLLYPMKLLRCFGEAVEGERCRSAAKKAYALYNAVQHASGTAYHDAGSASYLSTKELKP